MKDSKKGLKDIKTQTEVLNPTELLQIKGGTTSSTEIIIENIVNL